METSNASEGHGTTTRGRFTIPRGVRRALVGTAVSLAVLTGLVGFLHMPAARPLLARLGMGCPMPHASPEEVQRAHFAAMNGLRTTTTAPVRPAMGLVLDAMTLEQARAWSHARGLNCDERTRGMPLLVCRDVAPGVVGEDASRGPVTWLTLSFDTHEHLVGVDALRTGLRDDHAAHVVADVRTQLTQQLGAPTDALGEAANAGSAATVHNAELRYRFRDYVAMVTAMQLPASGVAVREQYLSTAPRTL